MIEKMKELSTKRTEVVKMRMIKMTMMKTMMKTMIKTMTMVTMASVGAAIAKLCGL